MGKDTAAQKGYHHGSHGMDKEVPHGMGDDLLTIDRETLTENHDENAEYTEGYEEGKADKEESGAKDETEAGKGRG